MPRTPARIRPHLAALHPYIPGEQPEDPELVKLNTNENPFAPSPHVLKRLQAAVNDQLRLYPHPTADPLRRKLAQWHGVALDQIIVGNGSDELLALATRAFVEPGTPANSRTKHRHTIQYFSPSYSLYPVLTAIQDATPNPVPLTPAFGIPRPGSPAGKSWAPKAALSFVTTPNAPSGRPYRTQELRRLCQRTQGVVILDEAYVDFAPEDALELVHEFDHVLVSRTFSKAYSLCFQRIGYFVGPEPLITALHKIRDSYNVNGLAQVAAEATLESLPYYRKRFASIIQEREKLSQWLKDSGFRVYPSATNFLFVVPPRKPCSAEGWFQRLRQNHILVRYFPNSAVSHALRISIGTPAQNRQIRRAVGQILQSPS